MTVFDSRREWLGRRSARVLALVAGASASALGVLSACAASSSDASGFGPGNPYDGAAASDAVSPADGSSGSDGGEADAAVPLPTSVIAVNASPDLWDFRLCFGYSATSDGKGMQVARHLPYPSDATKPIARTNFPGVPISGGVPIPFDDAMASALWVTPFVLRAQFLSANISSTRTCDDLINCGSNCLAKGDYWPLPAIAPATIARGASNLLVVYGCPPISGDENANAAMCGASYDAARGNLGVSVQSATFDGFLRPATLRGIFANWNSTPGAVGPMNASFDRIDADGGANAAAIGVTVPFPSFGNAFDLGIPADASAATYRDYAITLRWTDTRDAAAPLADGAADDAGLDDASDADPRRALTMSLEAIQGISDPLSTSTDFYAKGPFVFAVVGDPSIPGGAAALDGSIGTDALRALHVVAIPAFPADTSGIDAGP